MASKRNTSKQRNPNDVHVIRRPGEDDAVTVARTVLQPTVQAAATIKQYGQCRSELDLTALSGCLMEQSRAINRKDFDAAETMLTAQAHTLDAIFNTLAQRAINAENMDNFDRLLKLALRAQSQSRASWEALSAIKNPPLMGYIRQANIAHGHQQVNIAPSGAPCAGENQNLQYKLLEEKDGERLATGTTYSPGGADQAMATVGEVDRAED